MGLCVLTVDKNIEQCQKENRPSISTMGLATLILLNAISSCFWFLSADYYDQRLGFYIRPSLITVTDSVIQFVIFLYFVLFYPIRPRLVPALSWQHKNTICEKYLEYVWCVNLKNRTKQNRIINFSLYLVHIKIKHDKI